MAELTLDRASARLGGRPTLRDVSLSVGPGELVVLLGANGAGKTTLLRAALGLTPLESGRSMLAGADAASLTPMARARRAAYLPQMRPLAWPLRVRDVVALGRYAFGAAPGRLSPRDAAAVERALVACNLERLADRSTTELSGGERARCHLARALAAEAPLLIADEPTAGLDPLHAHRALQLVADFVARGGGALLVLHDIAAAAGVATRLAVLKEGALIADGPAATILTPQLLAEAFGVDAAIGALNGRPVLAVAGASADPARS